MAIVLDALSWAAIVAGGLLLIIGAVGILRFPDVYARMHAAGIIDTLGAGLLLLGLAFQAGLKVMTSWPVSGSYRKLPQMPCTDGGRPP